MSRTVSVASTAAPCPSGPAVALITRGATARPQRSACVIFDDDCRFGVAMGTGGLRRPVLRARLRRRLAMLMAVIAAGGMFEARAGAGSQKSVAAQISFYGDIGNVVNSANRKNPLLVRPSTLLLTEDGSVVLIHLKWRGWGTSVARATGTWSSSNCTPSCATGKLTRTPARLILSSPGFVAGHRVYRCFRVFPPHPRRDIADRACIRRRGTHYVYTAVPVR